MGGKNRNFAAHFGKCCSYGATLRQPLPSQNRRPKHLKIASLLSPLNLVIPNSPIVRNPYPTPHPQRREIRPASASET